MLRAGEHTVRNILSRLRRQLRGSRQRFATVHNHNGVGPSNAISDQEIARLAAQPLHPLTLADLVKHGPPPLSQTALYQSANFALSILPTRLAHRIQSLRNLPFIIVTNPHVSQIHNNYVHSLSTLLPFAQRPIDNPEDESQFTEALAGLVKTHSNTIPVLARGFLQSTKYISESVASEFLNEHLRARIGTRLVAEQHIAHHDASQSTLQGLPPSAEDLERASTFIGVIDTALQPALIVRNCESFVSEICELRYGIRPTVVINGDAETRIAHIPMHLEYIMTELLKNAFRAVIERGRERHPIEVTIAPAPEEPLVSKEALTPKDQGEMRARSTHIKPLDAATPGITIRIRDRGGGITPEHYANIWNFSFTTYDEHQDTSTTGASDIGGGDGLGAISSAAAGQSSIAGLGYGLPLSRAYAEYFGGGIALQNLDSWGCDVYLSLRGVGKIF